MNLSEFISGEVEAILREWEQFARTILPAADGMSIESLRDHAREMLINIARDMQCPQSEAEQLEKSRGRRLRAQPDEDSAAEAHAIHRLGEGFSLNELISEYRALRASVIRLWTAQMEQADRSDLDELTRFNEAIDEAITQSVACYSRRLERSRTLMLGALGHDLRNPLSAILQSAQYLLRAEELSGADTRAAARILSSGTRMKQLISDLLDFASTRLGDVLPMTPAPIDIGSICQTAVDEMAAAHPSRDIHCHVEGKLAGCWDAGRIAQLLSNLIGNAIEHGTPDTSIWLSASSPSDSEVRVEVHNDGPPIPHERRRNLFEPLSRGVQNAAQSAQGHRSVGLGLYIASQIARAHGGILKLASSDEAGTTFALQLPKNLQLARAD